MKGRNTMCNNPNDSKAKKVFKVIGMVLGGIILAGLFALGFGLLLRELWNALMPAVFGLGAITYWQAVGLFVLAKLLFSGLGGHGPGGKKGKKGCGSGLKKEFRKEFGKEFRKEFKKEFARECGDTSGSSGDKMRQYGEFWKSEGKQAFNEWLGRQEKKD